jgi:hypothetical protein
MFIKSFMKTCSLVQRFQTQAGRITRNYYDCFGKLGRISTKIQTYTFQT